MIDMDPKVLSMDDWLRLVREQFSTLEQWGVDGATDEEKALSAQNSIYAVKFNPFTTSGPGYSAVLYSLFGDVMGNPAVIIERDGKLVLVERE